MPTLSSHFRLVPVNVKGAGADRFKTIAKGREGGFVGFLHAINSGGVVLAVEGDVLKEETVEEYRRRTSTPSGAPGPGAHMGGAVFAPGTLAAPGFAAPPPMTPEQQAAVTVRYVNKWSWPKGRVPQNAQEREEKAAYDGAHDELIAGLAGATAAELKAWLDGLGVKDLNELLKVYEQMVGSSKLTNAENAAVQGVIDALREWLAQPHEAPKPVQVPVEAPKVAAAPTVAQPVVNGLGHGLPWPNEHAAGGDDRKLVEFIRGLKSAGKVSGGWGFELLKFARAVWAAHAAGDPWRADDLLADALANSDPKFAQALKDIEEFARDAEPIEARGEARRRWQGAGR
jgi:hypothetical protein